MVTLPQEYQEYLDEVRQMPRGDFEQIDGLFKGMGLRTREGERINGQVVSRRMFFAALNGLREYGEAIRAQETGGSNQEAVFSDDPAERVRQIAVFEMRERARPSSKRLAGLAYLFLHYPEVQREYLQIQAEKMVDAFPGFVRALQHLPTQDLPDRHAYFVKTEQLMTDSMLPIVQQKFRPFEVDLLSWVIGYENHRFQPLQPDREKLVAGIGNQTFTDLLERVVDEARGRNLRTKLRKEFTHREGIGFRLMRRSLRAFGKHLEPAITKGGLDAGRALLDSRTFRGGVCPATFMMKTESGESTGRPIAFEYASVIVGRMPRQFPRRA
jgi:hypothetical protein